MDKNKKESTTIKQVIDRLTAFLEAFSNRDDTGDLILGMNEEIGLLASDLELVLALIEEHGTTGMLARLIRMEESWMDTSLSQRASINRLLDERREVRRLVVTNTMSDAEKIDALKTELER